MSEIFDIATAQSILLAPRKINSCPTDLASTDRLQLSDMFINYDKYQVEIAKACSFGTQKAMEAIKKHIYPEMWTKLEQIWNKPSKPPHFSTVPFLIVFYL
jgi:hypothetical protein